MLLALPFLFFLACPQKHIHYFRPKAHTHARHTTWRTFANCVSIKKHNHRRRKERKPRKFVRKAFALADEWLANAGDAAATTTTSNPKTDSRKRQIKLFNIIIPLTFMPVARAHSQLKAPINHFVILAKFFFPSL